MMYQSAFFLKKMKKIFFTTLLFALTQSVSGQIKVTDIPANLKPAVEWVYNNRFVAKSASAPIGEGSIVRQNLILDQIYDNGGYLNYVVRWQSSKSLTLVQRQKMQGFIERQVNLWTKHLVGYENWPFDFIPVKIVGWAVDDASKILDRQPNEVVYTSFTRDGLADSDPAIYANLPSGPDQCSREKNWQNPNYTYQQCPQGPGGMFNMYLWATQGWNNGGAVGGDWGQRMSDINYLNNLDAASYTMFVHELGHGFGITDFYETNQRPPNGFPIPLVMWAGNSPTITDLDIWMLRYIWYYISQDKTRFPNTTTTKYTLTASVAGSGTVSPASGSFNAGSVQTLTAKPASGYVFTGWSGDATGTANPLTVSMSANKTIKATFTAIPVQTITYNVEMVPNTNYAPTVVPLNSAQIAQFFGLTASQVTNNFGKSIKYFGVNSDGTLDSVSTANAPGHWFNKTGGITAYGDQPYLYSELDMSKQVANVGHYPGKVVNGESYSFKQALVYTRSATDIKQITLNFNISITSVITGLDEANGEVIGTIYPNPSNESFKIELSKPSNIGVYSLDGQQLMDYKNEKSVVFGEQLKAGIYLVKAGNSFYKIVKE